MRNSGLLSESVYLTCLSDRACFTRISSRDYYFFLTFVFKDYKDYFHSSERKTTACLIKDHILYRQAVSLLLV